MTRLLIALLLLATPAHAGMVIGSGAADYTDIIFWAGFENGDVNLESSNCNTAGGDHTWTPVPDATINSTNPIAGIYDLSCPTGGDNYNIGITSGDYFHAEKGAIVFAVKPVTQLNDNHYMRLNDADATDRIILSMRSTDELRVTWYAAGATETTTTSTDWDMATDGTVYYVVYVYDATANTQSLDCYLASDGSHHGGQVTNATAITELTDIETSGQIRAGDTAGASTSAFYLDKIVIFDGSIVRTPAEYLAIVRGNDSCPK